LQVNTLSSIPPFCVGKTVYTFRFSVAPQSSHFDPLRLFNSLSMLIVWCLFEGPKLLLIREGYKFIFGFFFVLSLGGTKQSHID
jgi:hypothetical protein